MRLISPEASYWIGMWVGIVIIAAGIFWRPFFRYMMTPIKKNRKLSLLTLSLIVLGLGIFIISFIFYLEL